MLIAFSFQYNHGRLHQMSMHSLWCYVSRTRGDSGSDYGCFHQLAELSRLWFYSSPLVVILHGYSRSHLTQALLSFPVYSFEVSSSHTFDWLVDIQSDESDIETAYMYRSSSVKDFLAYQAVILDIACRKAIRSHCL